MRNERPAKRIRPVEMTFQDRIVIDATVEKPVV
jgi:hypothetical protein